MIGMQHQHQVEFESYKDKARKNGATCTQKQLSNFLDKYPESALSKIYNLDAADIPGAPKELDSFLEMVTRLLIDGKIYYPYQSLQALSDYLDILIFAPETGLLKYE
jgi:hypothetical protein